jgi:hypothetical protein
MKPKIILAGSSLLFHPYYQYNPFTTVWQLQQEGPGIQAEFRKEEQLVRGRAPKQPVVEEAPVAVEVVPQPVVEVVPAEQPIAAPIAPTTPPPSTTTAEVPKRKLALKLKDTATVQRSKPKLVLRNQPNQ